MSGSQPITFTRAEVQALAAFAGTLARLTPLQVRR